MRFEVYIPAMDRTGASLTLGVEADNWMMGLRQALAEIGVDRALVAKSHCEIRSDQSVRVTDPVNGHIFIVRPLTPVPPAASAQRPQQAARRGTREVKVQAGESFIGQQAQAPAAPPTHATPTPLEVPAPPRPGPPASPARGVPSVIVPGVAVTATPGSGSSRQPTSPELHLGDALAMTARSARKTRPDIAKLNVETQYSMPASSDLTPPLPKTEPAVRVRKAAPPRLDSREPFVAATARERGRVGLDNVLRLVPAEAAWLLLLESDDKVFRVSDALGTSASQVVGQTVPVEAEAAGMCLLGGVAMSLAGPSFRSRLAERIGLDARSALCAPINSSEGVRGAVQLINREGGTPFSPQDVEAVTSLLDAVASENDE